ncbi:hypothetical protein BURK2_03174 [Burkholderiales bacterium]|nr:hypothetical protein BURK2_03174 [Burkholderiales bacterium]
MPFFLGLFSYAFFPMPFFLGLLSYAGRAGPKKDRPGAPSVSHPALEGRGFLATSLSGACGPWFTFRRADPP